MDLQSFIKEKRKLANLTQPEITEKAGVGLRFISEMEQGKVTLRMDKVKQVLKLFGCELGPVEKSRHASRVRINKYVKMKKAEIKVHQQTAGWLTQDESGYHFIYDPAYHNAVGLLGGLLNCSTWAIRE